MLWVICKWLNDFICKKRKDNHLLDVCLEKVKTIISNKEDLENIKIKIIEFIADQKEVIKRDYATKLFRKLHLNNKFKTAVDINSELERINQENNKIFLDNFNDFEKKFEKSIADNDYDSLMILVPGKNIWKTAVQKIGIEDYVYENILLSALVDDQNLVSIIRNRIFVESMEFLSR